MFHPVRMIESIDNTWLMPNFAFLHNDKFDMNFSYADHTTFLSQSVSLLLSVPKDKNELIHKHPALQMCNVSNQTQFPTS